MDTSGKTTLCFINVTIPEKLIHVNYAKVISNVPICYDKRDYAIVIHDTGVRSMKYYELFALRIQRLCKEQGITINRLATLSGLRQSTIDNIIRGTSKNPKVHTLHQIAVTFNMTLSEFLDFPELNDYPIDDEDENGLKR